jgi:hypothetical protein
MTPTIARQSRSTASFGGQRFLVLHRISFAAIIFTLFSSVSPCQQASTEEPRQPDAAQRAEETSRTQHENKRILGIIPNYRTSPSPRNYEPLTIRKKFTLASEDAFDRGTVAMAVVLGGQAQLTNANRSFGQGAAGFGRYFGTAYGDIVIGDYMTEAVFPTLFRQDPRYFRRGTGSGWSRLAYSMKQAFWTHADSGRMQFNYSEVIGNATAVAISQAYYADNRTASDAVSKLGVQFGVDMAANIAKEFWPDLQRKFRRKRDREAPNK